MEMASKELSCAGLVLRAQEYSDRDLIFTLLTQHSGKVAVLARGARGGQKFKAGIPDVLDVGIFDLRKGRGTLFLIHHYKPEHTFKNLRKNLSSYVCACCWIESLEHLTMEAHQDSHELFTVALAVLKMLDEVNEPKLACRILCEGLDAALQKTGFGSESSGAPPSFKKLQTLVARVEEVSNRELKSWGSVLEIVQSLPEIGVP